MNPDPSERHVRGATGVSAGDVIDRLRLVWNVERDVDLAARLHVAPGTIATWRKRNSIPYEHCIEAAIHHQITLNWLLLGDGPPHLQTSRQPVDLNLLLNVVEALEKRFLILSNPNDPINITPREKALFVVSNYRWWADHVDNLVSTGKFTREEAIETIERTADESYKLKQDVCLLGPGRVPPETPGSS